MSRIAIIQEVVAARFGITVRDMTSLRRAQREVRPRHVAMLLARDITRLSLPQIGDHFGGRDHSSVMHALRRVVEIAKRNPDFRAEIEECRVECQARLDGQLAEIAAVEVVQEFMDHLETRLVRAAQDDPLGTLRRLSAAFPELETLR